jgi:hypothetical protein
MHKLFCGLWIRYNLIGYRSLMEILNATRAVPARPGHGPQDDDFPGRKSDSANASEITQAKSKLIRAQLAARWPAQYADGVAVGLGEKPESPREPGDYPKGFHTWLPERRNAWWAGANMGAILFSKLQDGGSDE